MTTLQEIQVLRIDGTSTSLKEFDGKVLLVVNVASKCGLTPQYEGL
jgi:glutathione peroxidase